MAVKVTKGQISDGTISKNTCIEEYYLCGKFHGFMKKYTILPILGATPLYIVWISKWKHYARYATVIVPNSFCLFKCVHSLPPFLIDWIATQLKEKQDGYMRQRLDVYTEYIQCKQIIQVQFEKAMGLLTVTLQNGHYYIIDSINMDWKCTLNDILVYMCTFPIHLPHKIERCFFLLLLVIFTQTNL